MSEIKKKTPFKDLANTLKSIRKKPLSKKQIEKINSIIKRDMEDTEEAIPTESVMSPQEAADFLNVSRPYLNKILNSGIISSYKDGKHRRVYFKDLILYKIKRESSRNGLDELTKQSQKNNMG